MTSGGAKGGTHAGPRADAQAGTRAPFWVTRRAARGVLIAVHAAALAAVLVEVIMPFPADSHAVERVHALDFTASYAVYGFVACVVLVLLGIVLRRLVIRPERYYEGSARESGDA